MTYSGVPNQHIAQRQRSATTPRSLTDVVERVPFAQALYTEPRDSQESAVAETAPGKPESLRHRGVSTTAQGIGFAFLESRVDSSTPRYSADPHHVVVVHRRGVVRAGADLIQQGPPTRIVDRIGEIQVIPASHSQRAPVLGRGHGAFCEITVPPSILGNRTVRPRRGHRDPFLYAITERLAGLSNRDDGIARQIRDGLGEVTRLHLRDYYTDASPGVDRDAGRTLTQGARRALIEYLDLHLGDDLSLEMMAAQVCMTKADFLKAFRDAFASTPHQYVIRRRIQRARELLAGTASPVTDVGFAVGFSTPSHFATTFKQHVGMPPSAYRSALRQ